MEIETKLKRSQYIIVQYILLLRGWIFYILLIPFLIFLFAGITQESETTIIVAVGYLIILILEYSIYIFWNVFSIKNRNFYLPSNWILKDDSVFLKTPISEETFKWSKFVDRKIIPGFYILYISGKYIYIFPKSAFTKESMREFEMIVQSKLP